MANPVVVEWIVKGIPDVQRGARSVGDAVAAAERAATRATERETRTRAKLVERETREKISLHERVAREAERAIKAETRASETAAKEKLRIAARADNEARRIRERALKDAERDEAKRARNAARESRERDAEAKREYATRVRYATAIAGAAATGVRAGASRIGNYAGQVAGMVGQLGGGFSVADSVQRGVSLKGKLADIASRDIDPTNPEKKNRKSTASLEAKVRGVSAEFGIDADTGANALDKFASKTGELKVGMDMLRGLGELSRAGAGSMDDLADAAGDIFNADKTQNAEQVLGKLRQFAVQGQKGAVEMKDLASQMAKIGAAAGRFEGGADRNLLTFGALAQGARESGGAASAREATTAVSSLSNQFFKNARLHKMRELGVDPKTKEGFNRPVEEVLFDLMRGAEKKSRASGKGLHDFDANMGTAIMDAQARKATSPLEAAFKKAGGGDAGIAAARAQLAKYGAGGRDLKAEFAGKAKDRMGEADAQMEIIKQKFDEAVSTKIIPALLKLVPEFEKMVPMLVDLNAKALPAFVELLKSIGEFASAHKGIIDDIVSHPVGSIMAFEVSKSIVAANIGSVIKSLLSGGGASTPGVGGAGGAAGGVGAGLAVIAGGALQGKFLSDQYDMVSGGGAAAERVAAMARGGDVSGAQAAVGAAQKKGSGASAASAYFQAASRGLNYVNPAAMLGTMGGDYLSKQMTGTNQAEQIKGTLDAKAIVDSESIKKAISDAVAAGAQAGAKTGPGANRTDPIVKRATQ